MGVAQLIESICCVVAVIQNSLPIKKAFVSNGSLCSTRISHKTAFNYLFAFVLVNYRNGLFQCWTLLTSMCSTTLSVHNDLLIFPISALNCYEEDKHLWKHAVVKLMSWLEWMSNRGLLSARMQSCQYLNNIFYRNHWRQRRASSGSTHHLKYRQRRYCFQACMSCTTSRRDEGREGGWGLNYSWQRHRSAPSDGFIIGFGQVI